MLNNLNVSGVNPVPLVFGAIFAGTGLLMLTSYFKSKKKFTAVTTAEVTGYREEVHHRARSGRSRVFFPKLRYYVNGEWYDLEGSTGRGTMPYAIGSQLEIHFDPAHPEKFAIAGDKSSIVAGLILMGMGLLVCVLAFTAQ